MTEMYERTKEARMDDEIYSNRSANAVKPSSPMMVEYGNLEKSLAVLHDTFDELRVKLTPVINDNRACGIGESTAKPEPVLSPLANSLRGENDKITRLNNAMLGLIDQIEL